VPFTQDALVQKKITRFSLRHLDFAPSVNNYHRVLPRTEHAQFLEEIEKLCCECNASRTKLNRATFRDEADDRNG